MVLVDLPPLLAEAFRFGEGLDPDWKCTRTAHGLLLSIRWNLHAEAESAERSPGKQLNSRQRRSKRRLEKFLHKKEKRSCTNRGATKGGSTEVLGDQSRRQATPSTTTDRSSCSPPSDRKVSDGVLPTSQTSRPTSDLNMIGGSIPVEIDGKKPDPSSDMKGDLTAIPETGSILTPPEVLDVSQCKLPHVGTIFSEEELADLSKDIKRIIWDVLRQQGYYQPEKGFSPPRKRSRIPIKV